MSMLILGNNDFENEQTNFSWEGNVPDKWYILSSDYTPIKHYQIFVQFLRILIAY